MNYMNWIEFIVDSSNQDVRLDVALSKHPNVSSRTEATKLIKQKYVFLNDNNNLTPKKKSSKRRHYSF